MIVGLGIDLLEISRVAHELARGDWRQEDGVFLREEIQRCSSVRHPERLYAACFAAKEAALKALGIGISDLATLREVEVCRTEPGEYVLRLHGRLQLMSKQLGVRVIRVSVAVTAKQTGAMVILES